MYGDQQDPNVGGIQYSQDFSTNYTDRSLVDKAYVDSKLGNGGGTSGEGSLTSFSYRSDAEAAATAGQLTPGGLYAIAANGAATDPVSGRIIMEAVSEYSFHRVGTIEMLVPDYQSYTSWHIGTTATTVIYNSRTYELTANGNPANPPYSHGSNADWTMVDNTVTMSVSVGLDQRTAAILWIEDHFGNHVNSWPMYDFPWGCPRFTYNTIRDRATFQALDVRGTFQHNLLMGRAEVKLGTFDEYSRIANCTFEDETTIGFPTLKDGSRWLFSNFKGECTVTGDFYNAAYFISTEVGSNAYVGGEFNGVSFQYSRIHHDVICTATDYVNKGVTIVVDRDEHTWPKTVTLTANGDLQGHSTVGRYIITPATPSQAIGVVLMPTNVQAANVGVAIDWTIRLEAAVSQTFIIMKSNTHFKLLGDSDLTLADGQYATFLYDQYANAFVQRGGKQ